MQLAYVGQFRVGTVVLGVFGTAVAVGEYTVASRIAEGLVILAAALTASSLPLMGGAFAQDDAARGATDDGPRHIGLSLLAAAPMVAVLTLTAPLWIAVLFPRYPGAAEVFIPVGSPSWSSSRTARRRRSSTRPTGPVAALSASVGLAVASSGPCGWWPFGAIGVAVAGWPLRSSGSRSRPLPSPGWRAL